ncbi:MAG: hypothetical protein U9N61_02050 [Euryarchaeota archaeon]|nr:hypothetical protein [Euryarchaeota archaeon]
MARIKHSKEPAEEAATPKRTQKPFPSERTVIVAKQHVGISPKKAPEPLKPEETVKQPKRRTLQDRRPALKELQKPVERKIVTKPIYGKSDGIVTKTISETKEIVVKPKSTPEQGTLRAKPLQPRAEAITGRGVGGSRITEARLQQEQAIAEARAVHAAQQREEADTTRAYEQRKREQEEASYRLSLDNQGRYTRKR